VLGGGIVEGGVVLIGGDPGIGKSTLLLELATLMAAPAVFAFGLVAFGFLGMGPVTIAVAWFAPAGSTQ